MMTRTQDIAAEIVRRAGGAGRFLIAIAGPPSLVGQFVDVVITEPMRNSLRGRLVAGETHKSVA